MRRARYSGNLRPADDVSQFELDRMRYYREHGKAPGNPKWYSVPRLPRPFTFKPGLPAIVPAWTRQRDPEPAVLAIPGLVESADEYVREFDTMNGLKPHPIHWVRVPDGNYA